MTSTAPSTPAATSLRSHAPLSALGKLSLGAQIATATLSVIGGVVLQVLVGHGVPLLIIATLLAAGAWLTATGFLWGPIPGALIGAGDLIFFVVGNPYPVYHLSHPQDMFAVFAAIVLGFGLAMLTFGACLAAVLQNYLTQDRSTPAWLTPAVSALAGIVVGAILIGALAAPTSTAATSTINGVPAVHLGPGNFNQTAITIPVGSKLVFADDAGVPHILAYGSWDQGRAHGTGQPAGAPPLNDLRINSGDVTTGPFTTAGTYHIYCLIHPGMNLTVAVQ